MPKTTTSLGIELVGDDIRLALVESGDRGLQVLSLQTLRQGDDLSRALRALPRRPQSTVCALPLESGGIRILSLPPTTDENLERVVLMEAEGVLPVGSDELAMSHQTLGMTEQSRLEVLLVAARQSAVDRALRQVNSVPWISARSTLGAVAAINALQQLHGTSRPAVCAILKVEPTTSELIILDRTRIVAAQSIPVGSNTLPITHLAEPVMVGGGAAVAPQTAWVTMLGQQVRYALQAVAYDRGTQVERIYLCGAGATHAENVNQLQEALGFPVTVLTPRSEEAAGSTYTAAYGCAVQAAGQGTMDLNLTAARVTVAREVEQRRQVRISWGALVAAVVAALVLIYGAVVLQTQRQVEVAEGKLRELGGNLPKPEVPPTQLQASLKAINEVATVRVPPAQAISVLNEELPAGTWLTELNYNADNGVVFRGYSTDQTGPQVAQIALLRRDLYDEVTLDSRTEELLEGKPVWGFQISCKLRLPERSRRPGVARR